MQRWCIYLLHGSYSSETPQGVHWDSLGVGAVEIGRIIAPNRRRHRQEAPKRFLATPAACFHFLVGSLQRGGVVCRLCSFHAPGCHWGALKDKKHAGGQKPPACFGTPCHSMLVALMALCRRIVYKYFANVEVAKKCFYVPATSLEALSAI